MKIPPKPKMTGWYDVGQLAQTGLKTFMSEMLGGMVDTRRFLALEDTGQGSVFDYSTVADFSFDYTGDTGDGWDSTYTMAYLLSSPRLTVNGDTLDRPHVLILGGDEVYPVASRDNYAQRLVWPFNQAARNLKQPRPLSDIFCVPGNHDWYDCLNTFYRRICNDRWLGSFQTRQKRSYYVLNLPNHWHIWSLDIQLKSEVDPSQRRFFKNAAQHLGPEDRIILCSAEPPVVNGKSQPKGDLEFGLGLFEKMVEERGARIVATLAGDTHNYQRYEVERTTEAKTTYKQWKIVAGGGGAFLHPTHSFPPPAPDETPVECKKRYPEEADSRSLSLKLILFPFANRSFAALLGAVHVFAFWGVEPGASYSNMPFTHPGPALWLLTLIGALTAMGHFRGKLALGFLHGLAQGWLACTIWRWSHDLSLWPWLNVLAQLVASSMVGGVLFGIYLWISLNVFRCHQNEAFSALQVADFKSFLRIKVQHDKAIVYAVGIGKIAGEEAAHPVPLKLVERFEIS